MDGFLIRIVLLMMSFLCLVSGASSQNQCYSCTYQVSNSGSVVGHEACYEQFNSSVDEIDIVNCTGECNYLIQETANVFQVTRGCSDTNPCSESTMTSEDYMLTSICCSDSLCNDETITNKSVQPLADDECYVCSYLTDPLETIGSPGCYEPFDASAVGVQKTQCNSSCLFTMIENGEDLTVTRDCDTSAFECVDTCVTYEDSSTCSYCCSPGTVCTYEPNEPAEPLADDECYVCTYLTGPWGTVGSPGCYEPFDASAVGVQKTQCNSSCLFTVVESAEDLAVTRDCWDFSESECVETCLTYEDRSTCWYCCSPGTVCANKINKPTGPLADDECYVCSYLTDPLETIGSPGCYEPFDASAVGVQKTQCNSSCLLSVIESEGHLFVTRGCHNSDFQCIEGCETSDDSTVCTHCCSPGTVCSKGALYLQSISLFLTTTFVCIVFFI